MSVDRYAKRMRLAKELRATGYTAGIAEAVATSSAIIFPRQTAQLGILTLSHIAASPSPESMHYLTQIANGHAIFNQQQVWGNEILNGILLPAILILASKGIERHARRKFL